MKKPTPPPCRLAELYDSVLNSLRSMDEDHRSSVIRALAGGLDDPEYRPWEYYFRAEPVPEGLTREAGGARFAVLERPLLDRRPSR